MFFICILYAFNVQIHFGGCKTILIAKLLENISVKRLVTVRCGYKYILSATTNIHLLFMHTEVVTTILKDNTTLKL